MLAGVKIPRMTGCAGACVFWPPVTDVLVIVSVATVTTEVGVMIARVIRVTGMPVIDRCPAIG